VENECISHNYIVLAIFALKISNFDGDFTKFWPKKLGHVLLNHPVYLTLFRFCRLCVIFV